MTAGNGKTPLTHDEAMEAILDASSAIPLSYEAAILFYLDARKISVSYETPFKLFQGLIS